MLASSIFHTLKSYAYTRVMPVLLCRLTHPRRLESGHSPLAVICDRMTWTNLIFVHSASYLSPLTWKDAIKQKPKFLFCEATWSGLAGSCWRGQVYRDRRIFFENRKNLLEILGFCNSTGIPTVFWAKEDPAYFMHDIYDFTDTALKFDHILTTAEECLPKYRQLGHKSVHLWPFGFSPQIYYPPQENVPQREMAAIFAGSWYKDHKLRCRELENIFEMVMEAGIPLKIYDRNKKGMFSSKPFPRKYREYVQDGVNYEDLGEIYRKATYVINVNTVSGSNTMFSRRVYEAVACGAIIVSNESKGLRSQFGKNVWYLGEAFDISQIITVRESNIKMVFENHTWQKRYEKLFEILSMGEVCS